MRETAFELRFWLIAGAIGVLLLALAYALAPEQNQILENVSGGWYERPPGEPRLSRDN